MHNWLACSSELVKDYMPRNYPKYADLSIFMANRVLSHSIDTCVKQSQVNTYYIKKLACPIIRIGKMLHAQAISNGLLTFELTH